MRVLAIAAIAWLIPSLAQAWNHTGHMIVAHLAYRQLSPEAKRAAAEILAAHPHYAEYLNAGHVAGIDPDEWVFLRAATWPDWVRDGRERAFSHPNWHYINLPFVPAGSRVSPPAPKTPNVITQLTLSAEQVRQGTAEDRAVNLCWVVHLVGDIHQPLHCAELVSEQFPRGDEGGNYVLLRIDNHRPTKLHAMWDDLLGTKTTHSAIDRVTSQIDEIEQTDRQQIIQDLNTNRNIDQWAQETFNVAVQYAYLEGRLPCANETQHPPEDQIPSVPEDYARQAGAIARVCVAKAGLRLAATLEEVLK